MNFTDKTRLTTDFVDKQAFGEFDQDNNLNIAGATLGSFLLASMFGFDAIDNEFRFQDKHGCI